MQAHNVLKCSNLHLLFYFIYFHAFFKNHRTYMRRNSIFHTNICKAQQSPHSHLCCPVCHLAPFFFFSWYFHDFFYSLSKAPLLHQTAANFIDSSATSHQHFRGTEMTSIQLLQLYLNIRASFAFIGKYIKK